MQPASSQRRLFAKFHAQTNDDVKTYVMEKFNSAEGHIRLLFAPVAFGMGVDVKSLYCVIHYGPPHDIEEFIQESGRAGRDGQQSTSNLIVYPGGQGETISN